MRPERLALIKQTWNDDDSVTDNSDVDDGWSALLMACRSFKSCCLTACCAQVQADDVENKAAVSTTGDGEVKSQVTVHPSQSESDDKVQEERKSTRLRAGSPWWVTRSNTNGRLFWVNEQTKEATWRQPTPPMSPLPADLLVGHSMREWAQVCARVKALVSKGARVKTLISH